MWSLMIGFQQWWPAWTICLLLGTQFGSVCSVSQTTVTTTSQNSDACLRLNKSLYGLMTAPRLFYLHSSKALHKLGFKPSKLDQCLWTRHDCMIIQYVDDIGIAAPSQAIIDEVVEGLRQQKLSLTVEGTFEEYLGIKCMQSKDGKEIKMTQKGLIKKILQATSLEDANDNWLPTTQVALGSDEDGAPMKEKWNYRSIVGMLLYLLTCTCPDIAFAVSQVARFSNNPKQSHASAVKTIVRYLKRTIDQGITMKPSGKLCLDAFVDADFAGLYKQENEYDPTGAKSRTGYILFLGDCALFWKSQLQTEISLSTLEAEYSALSACTCTVIFVQELLKETVKRLNLEVEDSSSISCTVWEDNNGALLLATNQRITSQTKYFHVKWHHFWSKVKTYDNPDGFLKVVKIESEKQRLLDKGIVARCLQMHLRPLSRLVKVRSKSPIRLHS